MWSFHQIYGINSWCITPSSMRMRWRLKPCIEPINVWEKQATKAALLRAQVRSIACWGSEQFNRPAKQATIQSARTASGRNDMRPAAPMSATVGSQGEALLIGSSPHAGVCFGRGSANMARVAALTLAAMMAWCTWIAVPRRDVGRTDFVQILSNSCSYSYWNAAEIER